MGPAGRIGSQGPRGLQGLPGPIGPQGFQGFQGPTGPQGLQGLPGPTGPQGLQGLPGPTGPQGFQGVVGPVGPVGPQGLIGVTGATGATGADGLSPAGVYAFAESITMEPDSENTILFTETPFLKNIDIDLNGFVVQNNGLYLINIYIFAHSQAAARADCCINVNDVEGIICGAEFNLELEDGGTRYSGRAQESGIYLLNTGDSVTFKVTVLDATNQVLVDPGYVIFSMVQIATP